MVDSNHLRKCQLTDLDYYKYIYIKFLRDMKKNHPSISFINKQTVQC